MSCKATSPGQTTDAWRRVPPENNARRVPEGHASACPQPRRDRRHPTHLAPSEKHNRSIIIFVTVCTAKRRKVLATAEAHNVIVESWQNATRRLVGRYVVMPDHVHFFCAPNDVQPTSLERWISYWKFLATRDLGVGRQPVWQRDHWDRQLRRGESYDAKWEYVRSNPVRHGLAKNVETWPYQGVLNELRW
jgi:putative transposase